MLRRFSPVLISPVLLLTSCTQALFSQKPQPPGFEERVSMYSKPAVVRVVAACFAEYSYSLKSKTKDGPAVEEESQKLIVRSNYPDENSANQPGYVLGTGYFINPTGYIVTTASLAKIEKQFGGNDGVNNREKCRNHLFTKILNRYYGEGSKREEGLTESSKGNDKSAVLETKETIRQVDLKDGDVSYFQDVILPNIGKRRFSIPIQGQFGVPSSVGPNGKDVAVIKIDVTDAPALKLSNSDNGKAQQVLITGYPGSADIFDPEKIQNQYNQSFFQALKSLIDEPKPVPISQNRSILSIRKLTNGSPILQIDGQVGNGSLGSPVLNEQGEVIGMVTDSIDLTYAVPSSTIRDYLLNIPNDEGDTQRAYRSGLEASWQGDYKRAIAEFEEVKRRFEDHSNVDELIKQSEAATPRNDYLPFLWSALIVVGLGVPTISYFLIHRRLQPVSGPSSPEASSYNGSTSHKSSQTGSSRPPDPTRVNLNPFIELSYQDQVLQFYLEESAYKLGRDQSWSDFEIPNKGWDLISRRHAILRKEGTDYRIYDGDGENKSSNGIFINDTRITPSTGYLLRHGVQVRIGPDQPNPVLLTYFNPANRQAPDPTRIAEL